MRVAQVQNAALCRRGRQRDGSGESIQRRGASALKRRVGAAMNGELASVDSSRTGFQFLSARSTCSGIETNDGIRPAWKLVPTFGHANGGGNPHALTNFSTDRTLNGPANPTRSTGEMPAGDDGGTRASSAWSVDSFSTLSMVRREIRRRVSGWVLLKH